MSDDTAPPAPPAVAPPAPAPAPAPESSALKSLLNPAPSGVATPSSTIVEAPRSPQRPPADPPVASASAEMNGNVAAPVEPEPLQNGGESASLPPLPADAPVPPSPKAADEPPPVLPPGAIPPAVSTPTVITEGGLATPNEPTPPPPAAINSLPPPAPVEPVPAASSPTPPPITQPPAIPTPPVESSPVPPQAPAPAVEQPPAPPVEPSPAPPAPPAEPATPAAAPAPSGLAEPAPTPLEATPAPAVADEPMDVDVPGPSSASSSLKRAGDELEGGDEKRAKDEQEPVSQTPASAPGATTLTPAVPAGTPGPPLASPFEPVAPAAAAAPAVPVAGMVPHVIPPSPEPMGPTTPLTQTQHKHLLASVRSLKKNKDALSFLVPLDPVAFGIPHYPQFITQPMDLGTVETKLIVSNPMGPPKDKSKMGKWDESKGRYNNVSEVALDVQQIRWNTERFNGVDHFVTQAGKRLEASFIKALKNMPPEPAPSAPVQHVASAGPSTQARRPSVSHPPAIRRTSETTDRPKREIHPPPSKDLSYADAPPRKKRRNDPQLQWAIRTIKAFETSPKTFDTVSPFMYPIEQIIASIPDYTQVIKKPIDLNKVKNRLDEGQYDDISQVTEDIHLIVSNALKYNPPQDPVAFAAHAFKQLWTEKLASLPPKQESRQSSEDPLAASTYDESDDDEDDSKIAEIQGQIADLQAKIDTIRAKQAKRKASKPKKPSKKASGSGGQGRKQSIAKHSPGANGHAKKARKSRDVAYDDDDEDVVLTQSQKSTLADRIGQAEERILAQAIEIIKKTQDVGSDGEIELDIEEMPPHTLRELYVLVVGPIKKARKSGYVPTGRKPGRKPGGPRKSMNEAEEAERIARMQAQLESFGGDNGRLGSGGGGAQLANGYNDDSDESSEEEDSDLE